MRDITQPPHICFIDPVSAMLGGIIPAMFGGGGDKPPPAPTPVAPPPQAPPPSSPQSKKAVQQPTFLGGVPTPPPSTGQKSLLGQ
jgi:hypothetical protein